MILKKRLMNSSCNPTRNNVPSHLESLIWNLDLYTLIHFDVWKYTDGCWSKHFETSDKVPTCNKNPDNPSCIARVTETLQSDFHKMTVTALKMQFRKLKRRVLFNRDYTKNSNETFINSLKPFVPNAPFLYPLKTLENWKFFYFQGVEKGSLGTNSLKLNWFPILFFLMKKDLWVFAKFLQRLWINVRHVNRRQ